LIAGIGITIITFLWLETNCGPICQANLYGHALNQGNDSPDRIPSWIQKSDGINSPVTDPKPKDANYLAEQDLKAQESMARSTVAIVNLSLVSIVLGLIGTFAIIWTLLETRRSVFHSIRAADAAQSAIGNERAWLIPFGCSTTTMTTIDQNDAIEYSARVRGDYKNSGKTPALDVEVSIWLDIVTPDFDREPLPERWEGDEVKSKVVIGPGEQFQTNSFYLSGRNYELFTEKKVMLLMGVRFKYKEVIQNRTCETRSVFRIKCVNYHQGIDPTDRQITTFVGHHCDTFVT